MRFENKNISLFITLLFITSQVLAFTSKDCAMKNKNNKSQSIQMDHSSHAMSTMSPNPASMNSSVKDCCEKDCDCSLGGCSTKLLTPSLQNKLVLSNQIIPNEFINNLSLTIHSKLLYRPPIFS
jgi:hypothetical protein